MSVSQKPTRSIDLNTLESFTIFNGGRVVTNVEIDDLAAYEKETAFAPFADDEQAQLEAAIAAEVFKQPIKES